MSQRSGQTKSKQKIEIEYRTSIEEVINTPYTKIVFTSRNLRIPCIQVSSIPKPYSITLTNFENSLSIQVTAILGKRVINTLKLRITRENIDSRIELLRNTLKLLEILRSRYYDKLPVETNITEETRKTIKDLSEL